MGVIQLVKLKRLLLPICLLSVHFGMGTVAFCQQKTVGQQADSLIQLMNLEEKIGQLHQISNPFSATGPIKPIGDFQTQIKQGKIGSMLNITGAARTKQLQQIAMKSRLKIPLLFGQDIIHGYRTTFPIPLAEAASWDIAAMEKSAHIAAIEAAAAGIHWTFAPMVDIARDPRWGRVMEGAGEDVYLGSLIAAARVKGFQGKGLGNIDAVMACAKHFAAYGAAVGGRDYNSVDMSDRQLWDTYLPPFKAALDAGVATFMNSFNDLNGIPATANAMLQRTILKNNWNFKGFIVSDWGSIGEMVNHGYAENLEQAAIQAMNAGNDVDMESHAYAAHLKALVNNGKVSIATVNDAVRRILIKKFEMGLFKDPYKFSDEKREASQWNNPDHTEFARTIAAKSVVLLKNDTVSALKSPLLPLNIQQKIAWIGPLVKAQKEHLGFWSFDWADDSSRIVSLWKGVTNKIGAIDNLLYAKGCNLNDDDTSGFAAAVATAMKAAVVVVSIGETRDMSGEAKSKSTIQLPGVQEQLVKAIYRTGKPMVVIVHAGRPLVFNWIADQVPSILYGWWLGIEAGNALADVLFGDYNPSGKLPISFPRTEGQIPIYYNYFNTGRPAKNDADRNYVSAYIDLPNSPKFPFGYGLSYTQFSLTDLSLNENVLTMKQPIRLKATIANTGKLAGTTTVQLYIRDKTASIVRPVKELKGFQQHFLAADERKVIEFIISEEMLRFYVAANKQRSENGKFEVMLGFDSQQVTSLFFQLKK